MIEPTCHCNAVPSALQKTWLNESIQTLEWLSKKGRTRNTCVKYINVEVVTWTYNSKFGVPSTLLVGECIDG